VAAGMKVAMDGADPVILFTTQAMHDSVWGKFGGG